VAQASLLEMQRLLCGFQLHAAATQPTAAPSNPEQPPCIPQEQPNFPPGSRPNMRGLGNRVKGSDGQVLYYTTAGNVSIVMIQRELRWMSGYKADSWRLWFVRRARKTTEKRRDVRLRHIEHCWDRREKFRFWISHARNG